MKTKSVVQSKIVWFNVVSALLAVSSVIPQPYGMVLSGIGNIVLRVWFTDKPIDGILP